MNLETFYLYALPLAMGLAGAALYHLLGPMLRGCIAAARFASFLCGWAIEAASQRENARAFAWDVVYGKEPTAPNTTDARLRNIESELVFNQGQFSSLACHTAKANVRLDAFEERMGKVEEQLEPTPLRLTNPHMGFYPYTPFATGAAIQEESERVKMQAMYKQWFGDSPSAGAVAPYGAGFGKPCPKPTKDLRPGDEVSVKMQVVYGSENTVKLTLAHKDYANSGEAFVARGDLDSMRTDV